MRSVVVKTEGSKLDITAGGLAKEQSGGKSSRKQAGRYRRRSSKKATRR